jgi:O-antigen chain-terminating methyltransferase
MNEISRVNYKGLSKQYVLQRLKISLREGDNNLENAEIEKDCTHLLTLDVVDFIKAVYVELLEREPNNEEYTGYIHLMCQGMPKEAVVYKIAASQEFADRFNIKHLDSYKKIYKKYIIKSKIKKLPIIRWYITLHRIPDFITEMRMIDINWRTSVKALNGYAEAIDIKVGAAHQKIDEHIKFPSLPQYLIVNGLLDKDSYLNHANSVLTDTAPEQQVEGNYYQLLEAVFRGSEDGIKKHQQYYIDYLLSNTEIRSAEGKYFLDAGCGRGELLALLQEHKINSVGIDINKISIETLNKKGYTVYCADILEYLNKIEDNELTGLSSFQVIEHLSKEYVSKLIETAYIKIANDGVILLETLNPYCYSNQEWFYIDPTHISWHSPDNLKLYLEYIGFCDVKIIYSAPVHPYYASKIEMMRNYIQFAVTASVKK